MAHLRKQIQDNVVTALTGLSTTGSWVYASRVYPVAAANLSGPLCLRQERGGRDNDYHAPRTQVRTLSLSVEGFAVATSGLDNTLDAISLEVEEALAVDRSRSNLAKDTRVTGMVVASVLMSMGMMMLPPIMIALPFKPIFFVLVDGWSLITSSLVRSFG